jgi:hypothetical protein
LLTLEVPKWRFLGQPQHFSPHPHPISDMPVDSRLGILCHVRTQ